MTLDNDDTAATGTRRFGLAPRGRPLPEWTVSEWFNTDGAPQLADLRGRVVVLHAFQILCPGCVAHGLPQSQRVQAGFAVQDVAVLGLHTVFEHHAAMTPTSLAAFLHEYRITFPVGVDAHSPGAPDGVPVTMRRYGLQGTPSLLLIDRAGHLRLHAFGTQPDLELGAAIATLVQEAG